MKFWGSLLALGAVAGGTLLAYARYVEPYSDIKIRNFKTSIAGYNYKGKIKIVHFTDVHCGKFIDLIRLNEVIESINKQNPDIVLFTGDLIDDINLTDDEAAKIGKSLKNINAPMGKFAVTGNHEYRGNVIGKYSDIMRIANFALLKNESINLADAPITIVGIDDMIEGYGDIKESFRFVKTHTYNIALCHEPDCASEIKKRNCDFVFSGHSHGGQVRIPLVGAIFLPPYAKKYSCGIYKISDQTTIHTSEGIGVTRLPFRFFSPPNIGVIEIDFI